MRCKKIKTIILLALGVFLIAVSLLSSCSINYALSVEAACAIDNLEESEMPALLFGSEHQLKITINISPLTERNTGDIYIDVVFENLRVEPTYSISSGTEVRLSDGRTGYRLTTQLADRTTKKSVEAVFRVSLANADIHQKAVCRIEIFTEKNSKIKDSQRSLFEKDVAPDQLGAPVLTKGLGSVELTLDPHADYYYLTIENTNIKRTAEQTLLFRDDQVYVIDFRVNDIVTLSLAGINHFSNEGKYSVIFDGGADYRVTCTAYSLQEGYMTSPTSMIIVRI